jgi:hypothetical protein
MAVTRRTLLSSAALGPPAVLLAGAAPARAASPVGDVVGKVSVG